MPLNSPSLKRFGNEDEVANLEGGLKRNRRTIDSKLRLIPHSSYCKRTSFLPITSESHLALDRLLTARATEHRWKTKLPKLCLIELGKITQGPSDAVPALREGQQRNEFVLRIVRRARRS
jgi:hypothetical protein